MFQNKLSIYMVKRMSNSNIYISHTEQVDLLDNLSTSELKLYSYLKFSPLFNRTPADFKADVLAHALNMAPQTVRNNLTSLKRKGYARIEFFTDERKELVVKVVVGKDQVELYSLGLDVEITDSKQYNAMLQKFPITDPTLPLDVRKELVQQANEYILANSK